MKPYQPTVIDVLQQLHVHKVLDVPSGKGWLKRELGPDVSVDGMDLFAARPEGYDRFSPCDMDSGLPADTPAVYDAIVSCEAIAYLTNPGVFFRSCHDKLLPGGRLVLSTPNSTFMESRLNMVLKGFFHGYPGMGSQCQKKAHLPLLPWSFPLLHHFLQLCGFDDIQLHPVAEPKPKHQWARLFGGLSRLHAWRHRRRSTHAQDREYWQFTGSAQATYGRRLVVSARKPL